MSGLIEKDSAGSVFYIADDLGWYPGQGYEETLFNSRYSNIDCIEIYPAREELLLSARLCIDKHKNLQKALLDFIDFVEHHDGLPTYIEPAAELYDSMLQDGYDIPDKNKFKDADFEFGGYTLEAKHDFDDEHYLHEVTITYDFVTF